MIFSKHQIKKNIDVINTFNLLNRSKNYQDANIKIIWSSPSGLKNFTRTPKKMIKAN